MNERDEMNRASTLVEYGASTLFASPTKQNNEI